MARNVPQSLWLVHFKVRILAQKENYDSADAIARSALKTRGGERGMRWHGAIDLGLLADLRGHMAEAREWRRRVADVGREQGVLAASLTEIAGRAADETWFMGRTQQAVAMLDSALRASPINRIESLDRPYLALARAYVLAQRPDRARELIAGFEKTHVNVRRFNNQIALNALRGDVALAERHYDEAIHDYRQADVGDCITCILPLLASAYDLSGNADSAIALFARYTETKTDLMRDSVDARYLAGSYKRLGELYEAKGEKQMAASSYAKFLELWKTADPELQPKVVAVRQQLARLSRSEER